jgi:truncated hemoglobin YjbI
MAEQKITEEEISNLVDRFYAKVQIDPEIGPIFNATVEDWPTHLACSRTSGPPSCSPQAAIRAIP